MDENAISESEVSPKEIIKQMKSNIYNNSLLYNNTLINLDYLLYRPSIFSLIHKISNRIGFKSQTYFLSIYYLDILHMKNRKIDLDLKVLALACLLLASKYAENDQNVPNLPYFVAIFNSFVGYNEIISNQELFFAEVLSCKLLEYKLNYYTIYDFDSFFFGHGIIKIEQINDLISGINNNNNDSNDINMEINENSYYIRKILEKIYRKSRYYLDIIINNGNICLKYSSLIISVVIMKKSVEDILIIEQKVREMELKEFKEKTEISFKEIMREIYQIDYESMEGYQNLINDNELKNIFQENNKRNSNYFRNTNLKFSNSIRKPDNTNINNRYQNSLNQSLNGNVFIKKINYSKNNVDGFNRRYINQSGVESEDANYLYFNKYKKERTSVPKRNYLNKNYINLSNFNSSFTNNLNASRNVDLSKNKGQRERKETTDKVFIKQSEINEMNKYMNTYTNDFYHKKRKALNSLNNTLITNMNNIHINDSYDDSNNIINIIDNNISIPNDKVLNTEDAQTKRNYEKYKKLVLKKRFFDRLNLHNNLGDYSITQLDNSNLPNSNIFGQNIPNQNHSKQPYYRKVIKNTTNYSIKQNSKVNSFYSTMNNNMYNPNKRKQNNLILLNPTPVNKRSNNDTTLDNELNIQNNDINQNATIEVIKNINRINTLDNNNNHSKKNSILNRGKKIYSNNTYLNSMTIENKDNNDTNRIKEEILLTSNNDYINKKNERRQLLFMRMRDINNKFNLINPLNNPEIKNNEFVNNVTKRQFLISNNIKKEIYDTQYLNQSINNKRNINKFNNLIINELKPRNINYKFNDKKTSENNKILTEKDQKKEKTNYPNSTILKLINRTKTMNNNKLNIKKEDINSELINKLNKNMFNQNSNKRSKLIRNMNTLDFTQENNTQNDSKNISKIMFNTIDNKIPNDTKENNNTIQNSSGTNKTSSIIHNYPYRNYMKNRNKKNTDKEINVGESKKENSKTIVINNNININFNNKIESSNIYQSNKSEKFNSKINDKKEFFQRMVNSKTINNRSNNVDYNTQRNVEGIKNNNERNKNISSLLHRFPFYKKSSGNNNKKYYDGISKDKIENDN